MSANSIEERTIEELRWDLAFAHESLVKISERTSEALAAIHEATLRDIHRLDEVCSDRLNEINLLIWQIRWEIGPRRAELEATGEESEAANG